MHADDGLVEFDGSGGAEELGVAEAEYASVACDEPVAESGRGAGHVDDVGPGCQASEFAMGTC